MQKKQFNVIDILKHAATWHGNVEVVTNSVEGGVHRIGYAKLYDRTSQLANALLRLGVNSGDRIGTMAWNTWRHLECWYGLSGIGAICHTLNPRLFPDQIEYIVNHAQNRFIFVDTSFIPIISNILDKLPTLEGLVVMTDKENMTDDMLKIGIPVYCYEELLEAETSDFIWPLLDEDTASSLCYTSGTTGNPKGVLYSHRSNLIHSMGTAGGDMFDLRANDSFLLIVPMFHANSWGLSFSVPMLGGKMVLPGPYMDGKSICEIIQAESCNKTCAVPTVMTSLIDYLDANDLQIPSLIETYVGGSAVPRSMIEGFEDRYDVDVIHGWGMTELNPVGVFSRPLPFMGELNFEQRMEIRCKQGRPPFGLEIKIVDDEGNSLPHDGVAFGKLMVRGPWVVERYYKAKESALDSEGWFDTGDVSTIDKYGFMQITDRAKDIIKSGGEWISSADIENTAVGHPEVQIAACLGVKHAKWEERPLLIVVKKEGCDPSKTSILDIISNEHAKWQLPDDVVFIDEMPLTATGKIDKKPLRIKYEDFLMEG
ncbi:MAG: long-chain fatty acid--CoA ligase [Gammaproteobacteria bacterium]|nr:long-chain fatty acid--CoA ligase [Gammaproteobacteria bacterium]